MKEIEIIFNKAKILDEVSLNSEYVGSKSTEPDDIYDRIATVEADTLLLSRFLAEMYGNVTEKLREFISKSGSAGEDFTLTLELSNAYDDSLTHSVKEDLFTAVAKGVAARWFRFTMPDRATEWLNESEALLTRAHTKLCFRRKPLRR